VETFWADFLHCDIETGNESGRFKNRA